MDIIERKRYINKIKPFINKPVIKILTGMRRVGKSTLMLQIRDEILKDIPAEQKVYMNFEAFENIEIRDYVDLKNHLEPMLKEKNETMYFFFDEIQLVEGWEKVINALRLNEKYDIYITGSNSNIISGELATLLAGRYVEFEIQPFVFSEFKEQYKEMNLSDEELFKNFLVLGGMPSLNYFAMEREPAYKYLMDIYNTVVVKDVMAHNNIRDVDIFNRIMMYAIENMGHTFSANKISKYLKSENRKISVDTILNYMEYMRRAFIIKKVQRYDMVGKQILKSSEKYYLTDHGFRNALGYSNEKDIERVLENIVYIELISRGYKVNIGKCNQYEIDFIAEKSNKKEYYQVSYLMGTEETRAREFGVYDKINDNFPKYVLSMDKVDFSQKGINHINIIDFLQWN